MYDDDHVDSPEVREAINGTLRERLSTDGGTKYQWDILLKVLREEFGIETDLLDLAQNAPCLVEMFQIGALASKGIIGREARETLSEIIHNLVRIAFRAQKGDELAANQLKVLHKVAHPFNYELPVTVIKNLAHSYPTSPHLARAWSVRSLMLDLSYMVEPTRGRSSLLDGPVMLRTSIPPISDPALYEKATKHIRRGSWLQSLAISIYIEVLAEEGINMDVRQIKLDLQKL
jgi:hypothetical protein